MGFNRTAVRTAVEEIGSGGQDIAQPSDQLELQPKSAAGESHEQFSRQPRAVLCGSYRRGIPALVRTYEKLTAAGMRVLSPSGLDFVAEIDGFVLNLDEMGIPPEAIERLHLNCIRAADLVWLTRQMVTLASAEPWKLGLRVRREYPSTPRRCPVTLLCARS